MRRSNLRRKNAVKPTFGKLQEHPYPPNRRGLKDNAFRKAWLGRYLDRLISGEEDMALQVLKWFKILTNLILRDSFLFLK